MTWHNGTLCALDFETTGTDVETDRIVTACVARVDGSGRSRPSVATWVADPGIEIPDLAAEFHGYTTERARAEGQPAGEVVAEVTAMLVRALDKGIPIVGFNVAAFDLTLLDRECRRYGLPTLSELCGGPAPVIDAFVLDKHVYRRSRKLAEACRYWRVRLDNAHEASADAWAAAGVAVRIAKRTPAIARMPLHELHTAQGEWKYEQDMGLAAWLRRKAAQARHVDDQLDLITKAKRVEAAAAHWPIIPFERQEQIG